MTSILKFLRPALPGLENDFAPVDLPLFDHGHTLPLTYVGRIDISTRFDAESRTGPSGWRAVRAGSDVQMLARVKLERRVRREHVEVQLRRGVVEARASLQRGQTRVWRHSRGVGVQHKAVVDIGLCGAKREGDTGDDVGVGRDVRGDWDARGVDSEVVGGCEDDASAGDGFAAAQVEVAAGRHVMSASIPDRQEAIRLTCGSSC